MELKSVFRTLFKTASILEPAIKRSIGYGGNKLDGSHDHRTNSGLDRTPAQKKGDESRRGPRKEFSQC